jgi:hypothetical protein
MCIIHTQRIAAEIAQDEFDHVKFLLMALGDYAVTMPKINMCAWLTGSSLSVAPIRAAYHFSELCMLCHAAASLHMASRTTCATKRAYCLTQHFYTQEVYERACVLQWLRFC